MLRKCFYLRTFGFSRFTISMCNSEQEARLEIATCTCTCTQADTRMGLASAACGHDGSVKEIVIELLIAAIHHITVLDP